MKIKKMRIKRRNKKKDFYKFYMAIVKEIECHL